VEGSTRQSVVASGIRIKSLGDSAAPSPASFIASSWAVEVEKVASVTHAAWPWLGVLVTSSGKVLFGNHRKVIHGYPTAMGGGESLN
jgi:hypothetical protein